MPIELGDAILRIKGDATALNTKLKQMQSDVNKNFGSVLEAGKKIGLGLAAVGTGIIAGLGLAVKESMRFESAFAGVRKTVKASEAEFKQLENQIKAMSKEMPVPATQLAKIAETAGQLGIKKENIISFTETIAKLGVATNLTGEEGAMMLARFANITGMPQTQFENLASAIVDLGNNSATTEKDIMEMAMRIAGAGTTAGIAPPKIIGVAAALSSLGIEAEAGGTAFSQLILKMQSAVRGKMPTEEIEKLNEKLRELTDSHNDKMEQLSGRLKNVKDRIRDIKAEAAQAAYEERMNAQIQAARRAGNDRYAEALEAQLERSRSLMKQQEQSNALQEAYNEQKKIEQEMIKENSAFEQARKKIAAELNGAGEALKSFAKISGVSVEEFKKIFEADATKAVEMFLNGIGKIQAAKGDVAGALAEMGLDGIRMTDTLLRASNAQGLFSASVNRGAEAFHANVAAAKEAAERFKTMESQMQMLKNSWTDLMDQIGRAVMPVLAVVGSFLKPIIETITAWIKANPELAGTIIVVTAALAGIVAGIGVFLIVLPTLVEAVGILGSALMFLFANPVGLVILGIAAIIAAGYALIKHWDDVKAAAEIAWTAICDGIIWIWEKFKERLTAQFQMVGILIGAAMRLIVKVVSDPKQALQDAWNGICSVFEWAWNKIKQIADLIWRVASAPFKAVIGLIKQLWSAFTGGMSTGFTTPVVPGYASGTSYARGGTAALAEEGPELVTGPGFYKLPRGSRVYNAQETASILNNNSNSNQTTNNFNISSLVVREEADIDRIAQKLFKLQSRRNRALGVA